MHTMCIATYLFQIWTYVELSEKESTSDDPTPFYMWHDNIQMTICETGPFPSENVPPSCNSE